MKSTLVLTILSATLLLTSCGETLTSYDKKKANYFGKANVLTIQYQEKLSAEQKESAEIRTGKLKIDNLPKDAPNRTLQYWAGVSSEGKLMEFALSGDDLVDTTVNGTIQAMTFGEFTNGVVACHNANPGNAAYERCVGDLVTQAYADCMWEPSVDDCWWLGYHL